ncbi:FAD-dependent oxidoreductase [Aspergillus stella-maris]|uniref:FAD-dependent oxidoreductase n=1 Tax=Aspergillus stella-maris TaxID=1810926 RepID=UPI003CCCA125
MDVTIIGSGVIGLLSALVLTDARYRVTIIARDLPGDENQNWASPWAGAGFLPHPETKDQSLPTESFKYYWALAHRDPTSGVQVLKATEYFDDRSDDSSIWYKNIVPGYRRLGEDKLYPNAKIGFSYQTVAINPSVFLIWVKKGLEKRGVRFIRREVKSFAEATKMVKTDVLVNATGLGAKELAGDNDVVPIRGQTIFMKTDFDEIAIFQGSHYTYVFP